MFFPWCPCIDVDIEKSGTNRGEQEPKELQQNDCRKWNQPPTMQLSQPEDP